MKQTVKYIVAAMFFACLSMNNVWAVAPLPGLGLTEHVRKPIPQGIVHQQRAARAAMEWQAPELVSRGLLIVVEFADTPLSAGNTVQSFDSLANADDYTYNGAMGSCKKYYQDQSNGKYTPQFDVVGPVVLPQTTAYYGTDAAYQGDDRYVADFVIDACKGAQGGAYQASRVPPVPGRRTGRGFVWCEGRCCHGQERRLFSQWRSDLCRYLCGMF